MILKSINEIEKNELKSFTCGNKELDNYLKLHALNNDQSGYGKTFVLVVKNTIVGFFTVCSSSIKCEEFPTNNSELFPRYPIPCIKIARLAVSNNYQGKGYGKILLKEAFLKILSASTTVGVRLVVVDAKATSATFYEKYGFERLLNNKLSYFLLLDTIKEALK